MGKDGLLSLGKKHKIWHLWISLWKGGLWMMPRPWRHIISTRAIFGNIAPLKPEENTSPPL